MKLLFKIVAAIAFTGLIACGSNSSSSNQQQEGTAERGLDSTTMTKSASESQTMPNCTIAGTVLDGNQFWIRDQQILVAIAADSTTYDKDLDAEGHRILEVYDTKTCNLIDRQVLPVDVSPDYAYYIAEITYNSVTQIVAIRGATSIYCYDVVNRKLLPKLTPKFRTTRDAVDAQSGQIQHLEVWENYLIGYAQDFGVFAFDLTDKNNPKPVMPFAEYKMDDTQYTPLFLVQTQGGMQAIMPEYNIEKSSFAIHPAFNEPIKLDTNVPKSATNNRYLVLRQEGTNNSVAFDLQKHERIELPADVASKNTQDILKWIRSNPQ